MSDAAQSAPAPDSERRLAEVIADHFVGARVVEADGAWVVELGEDLPVIECRIDTQQDHPPYGVFVFLSIRGGALGGAGALVTASGYGPSPEHALTLAGCNWACAFGPVLLTGIGRPELINTEDPDVELFETTLDGRRHLFAVGHLDRWSDSARAAGAERRRLGGPSALTRAVLTSGTIPSTRSDGVIALGCFLACGRATSTEVKLGTADWPAAAEVLERLAPPPDESAGLHMLREWAILAPLEPAPELTREGLQRTLDLLRACGADPDAEAGWHGARRHGMRLGEPGPADPALPAEANRFLTRIAALFSRRGFNIDSLAVGPTERPEISRMTVVASVEDESVLEQIVKQLNKLIEVRKVLELGPNTVCREMVLVKVRADVHSRSQIIDVVSLFRGKAVDVSPESVTIEATGSPEKLAALLEMLSPHGIQELVQSGQVALGRGARTLADHKSK